MYGNAGLIYNIFNSKIILLAKTKSVSSLRNLLKYRALGSFNQLLLQKQKESIKHFLMKSSFLIQIDCLRNSIVTVGRNKIEAARIGKYERDTSIDIKMRTSLSNYHILLLIT